MLWPLLLMHEPCFRCTTLCCGCRKPRSSPAYFAGSDPAAEAAAATARRGGEYLAAVDVKQRPLVAYLARSKIPRINRCACCKPLCCNGCVGAASLGQAEMQCVKAA